jgi:hypothetical protein
MCVDYDAARSGEGNANDRRARRTGSAHKRKMTCRQNAAKGNTLSRNAARVQTTAVGRYAG